MPVRIVWSRKLSPLTCSQDLFVAFPQHSRLPVPMEVAPGDRLRLVQRNGKRWLYHAGTGEKADLGGETAWLHPQDSGVVHVHFQDGRSVPHTAILKCGIFKGTRPGTDTEELFLNDGAEGTWLTTVLEDVKVCALDVFHDEDTRLVTLQVYHYRCGVPPSSVRVWWALPQIVEFVIKGGLASDWIGKNMGKLQNLLRESGIEGHELRRSRKGHLEHERSLKRQSAEVEPAEPGLQLQYATTSTRAVCTILLDLARGKTSKSKTFRIEEANAEVVLERLVDVSCKPGGMEALRADGALIFFVNENGRVLSDALRRSPFQPLRGCCSRITHLDEDGVLLSFILADLWKQKTLASRFSHSCLAAALLAEVLNSIQLQIEISVDEDWWHDATLLNLGHTRPPTRYWASAGAVQGVQASGVRGMSREAWP